MKDKVCPVAVHYEFVFVCLYTEKDLGSRELPGSTPDVKAIQKITIMLQRRHLSASRDPLAAELVRCWDRLHSGLD